MIVCVDAEADPAMRFSSFLTLQRYASIDLGIRINLPWQPIQAATVGWMGRDPLTPDGRQPTYGPHAAIGAIHYPDGQTGFLLYIKASLTGDESDFILDYARRYSAFPHEATGNQFFNEEQFEVYRALGYHIAHGVLSGKDSIVYLADPKITGSAPALTTAPLLLDVDPKIKTVREALLGGVPEVDTPSPANFN